jgi:chromosome segregation ATPase
MTNDELRTILRDEIGGAFVGLKDEVRDTLGVFRSEMREEMRDTLGVFRSEVREEMSTFKGEMREEMNTAIQAGETRMTQHIDQVQKNVLEVKGNVALLDQKVDTLDHKINAVDRRVTVLDRKVDQFSDVLNETTVTIADMQQSLFNLENKVDMYHATVKQEILRIDTAIQALVQQVFEMNRRLTTHIATPWNKAHPDPNSAA